MYGVMGCPRLYRAVLGCTGANIELVPFWGHILIRCHFINFWGQVWIGAILFIFGAILSIFGANLWIFGATFWIGAILLIFGDILLTFGAKFELVPFYYFWCHFIDFLGHVLLTAYPSPVHITSPCFQLAPNIRHKRKINHTRPHALNIIQQWDGRSVQTIARLWLQKQIVWFFYILKQGCWLKWPKDTRNCLEKVMKIIH